MLSFNGSLTDMALITGFYDQSHFINYFRKIIKMTPSKYLIAVIEYPTFLQAQQNEEIEFGI